MPLPLYRVFSGYYFMFFAALGIMTTLFPIYLGDLGLRKAEIGQIMAMGMLASVVGPPLWGFVSDFFRNRKQILLFCQLGAVIASFLLSWTYWIKMLIFGYFCFNFFQSAIGPLSDSLVLTQPEAGDYGKVRLWGSMGFAGGALVCGQALNTLFSFRVFAVHIVFGLITLVCISLLPKSLSSTWVQQERFSLEKFGQLIRDKQFRVLLIVLILVNTPYGSYTSFLGLYLNELGANRFEIGLAWTIAALVEVPVFAWGYKIFNLAKRWQMLAVAAAIFGIRWILYGYCRSAAAILLLQLSQSVSFSLFYLVAVQLVNSVTPIELKAVGQTIFGSVGFGVSFALGNLLGGYYAQYHGLASLFSISGTVAFLGALTALVASRRWSGNRLGVSRNL